MGKVLDTVKCVCCFVLFIPLILLASIACTFEKDNEYCFDDSYGW